MIRFTDVSWYYPHAQVPSVSNIDLTITPGEFVVLCGASGSGKSTLLRLMNGLIPHFHENGSLIGSVEIRDLHTSHTDLDEIGFLTGTVLQHPRRQFFTDTVPEEIAFAMENFGFSTEDIRNQVAPLVYALSQKIPVTQRLQNLSGGQQQQVAITAASAHRPKIILFDEPSSNLSADAIATLTQTLANLKEQGMTIVVAEHRLHYLKNLMDRVIVMHDGGIDTEWDAHTFQMLPDADLMREGLRGHPIHVDLPTLPAAGRSIKDAVPIEQVPTGDLELVDITCRFDKRIVLDVDRITFPAGTVTAIRGINGAGKSTLARIILGLQKCSGSIYFRGKELKLRERRRCGAIVMQDVQRQLFTESVEAEIDLARTDSSHSADTNAILGSLGLIDLADRHPLSLSGGQQQRLVIASVRVAERQIVIFDEPSSGVDHRHLHSISRQIKDVATDGAVVLLISHDEDLVGLTADQQITLSPLEHD